MKPALIIGSVLVVVGLIMSFVCFAIIGFDFKELNMLKPITNTYTVEEKFSSIEISSVEADLHILPSDNGDCHIICQEDKNAPHTVTVENGVLKIRREDKLSILQRIFYLSWGKLSVTLYLPEKDYSSLTAKTVSGDVTVDPGFVFKNNVSLKSVSGNVAASLLSCDLFSADTTSGNINLTTVSCSSFDTKTVSGESRFSAINCTGELTARSTSGNIRLDGCDAASLDLSSVSGNVSGTLLSPKSFETGTISGSVTLPANSKGGRCSIKTTSGNINFSLE